MDKLLNLNLCILKRLQLYLSPSLLGFYPTKSFQMPQTEFGTRP